MRIAAAGLALLLAVDAAAAASPAFRAEDRVIFTAEAAGKAWAWKFRPPAGPPWTPALADVLALEKRLPDYLRRQLAAEYGKRRPKDPPPLWERAPGYKRQYVGIRPNGHRLIHGNFFCEVDNLPWRTSPILVDDGGDCYFQVEYDAEKGTFSNLMVNGDG